MVIPASYIVLLEEVLLEKAVRHWIAQGGTEDQPG